MNDSYIQRANILLHEAVGALMVFIIGALMLELIKEGIVSNALDLHKVIVAAGVGYGIERMVTRGVSAGETRETSGHTMNLRWSMARHAVIWASVCVFGIVGALAISLKMRELSGGYQLGTIGSAVFVMTVALWLQRRALSV